MSRSEGRARTEGHKETLTQVPEIAQVEEKLNNVSTVYDYIKGLLEQSKVPDQCVGWADFEVLATVQESG